MSKMDIEKVAAYGDDLTNNTVDIDDNNGGNSEVLETKAKKRKRRDAQDRVVSAQICLAVLALVLFAVVKFAAPDLFRILYDQYTEAMSEMPVWYIEGIAEGFVSLGNPAAVSHAEV